MKTQILQHKSHAHLSGSASGLSLATWLKYGLSCRPKAIFANICPFYYILCMFVAKLSLLLSFTNHPSEVQGSYCGRSKMWAVESRCMSEFRVNLLD